jgi:hypothetical protein
VTERIVPGTPPNRHSCLAQLIAVLACAAIWALLWLAIR